MKFKSLALLSISAILGAGVVSCSKVEGCMDPNSLNFNPDATEDDGSCLYDNPASSNVIVTENIAENTTWTADKVYELAGRISVLPGVTLTIEPGTVIKGQAGTGSSATALLVARGAKLMAVGTETAPIIFTSVADEITPAQIAEGNFISPNLEATTNGLWGGLIVLGNAPVSASNDVGDVSEVQIEGIPTSDASGLYGGSDASDNSGMLKYISIRHGGANIGAGNEINGLTLGGVGNGTVIENIEVVGNQDDGIEWFGGSANVSNVVVWNAGDDALDTDQAWTGSVSNFVIITPAGHSFELDGPEGSTSGGHVIENGTVYASRDGRVSEDLINTDDNSIVTLRNIHITDIAEGQMINRTVANEGELVFENVTLNVPEAELTNYVNGEEVPSGISAGSSPAADVAPLSWTWAGQANQF